MPSDSMDFSNLSVVLVNYNDKPHLQACLSSVVKNVPGAEIILVDNVSSDGSPELVEISFPEVRLIRSGENVGYAKANNRAWRESRGEFVLFLNTDVIVYPGTLDLLLGEMADRPATGAVGPALLRGPDSYQVSFGKEVGFWPELVQKGIRNAYFARALRKTRRRREVGWVSGAFLLVRCKALEEAGGFDEAFFLYFEDIDLCRRLRRLGWKVVFLPQASSFHAGGATTWPRLLASRYEYRKSQVYYYRKHNSRISSFMLKQYLRADFLLMSMKGEIGKDSEPSRSRFSALLRRK